MTNSTAWEWTASRPLDELRRWAEAKLFPALHQYGFRVMRESDDLVVFALHRTAWWLALISVVAFWLSPDRKQFVAVSFAAVSPETSRITVVGDVPSRVRSILTAIPGSRDGLGDPSGPVA